MTPACVGPERVKYVGRGYLEGIWWSSTGYTVYLCVSGQEVLFLLDFLPPPAFKQPMTPVGVEVTACDPNAQEI